MSPEEIDALKYSELRHIAKGVGIKANLKVCGVFFFTNPTHFLNKGQLTSSYTGCVCNHTFISKGCVLNGRVIFSVQHKP